MTIEKFPLPGYRRFLTPDELRAQRIAEESGKLAPVLPFRRVENRIAGLISGPQDQRTKERRQRDLPRVPSLD
jgi:hypothetical protein